MQNHNRRHKIIKLVVVLIIAVLLCICCFSSIFMTISIFTYSVESVSEKTLESSTSSNKILIVPIDGVITATPNSSFFGGTEEEDMTSVIMDKLDRAMNDKNIKAIVLSVDSPGGEVYASELITNKIKEVQESGIKVVALFKNTAASGAYYISSVADKIVASESTITGSIGVIIQYQDQSGLYEKLGIKSYSITNSQGTHKELGDAGNKNSEDYKILERILNDTYDKFVATVAEGRNKTKEEIIKLADGRVYSGKNAKAVGLVDEIGYMNDAIEIAKDLAGISDAKVIEYSKSLSSFSSVSISINKLISKANNMVNDDYSTPKMLYILPF